MSIYQPIPRSFGAVFSVFIWVAGVAAVFVLASNVVGHVVPERRKDALCWLATDYLWPIDGWHPRYDCIAR